MIKNLFLIDWENVNIDSLYGISMLNMEIYENKIVIFYSEEKHMRAIKDLLAVHRRVGFDIEFYKRYVEGKNALDFMIATYVGINAVDYDSIFILSRDRGYESVRNMLEQCRIPVRICNFAIAPTISYAIQIRKSQMRLRKRNQVATSYFDSMQKEEELEQPEDMALVEGEETPSQIPSANVLNESENRIREEENSDGSNEVQNIMDEWCMITESDKNAEVCSCSHKTASRDDSEADQYEELFNNIQNTIKNSEEEELITPASRLRLKRNAADNFISECTNSTRQLKPIKMDDMDAIALRANEVVAAQRMIKQIQELPNKKQLNKQQTDSEEFPRNQLRKNIRGQLRREKIPAKYHGHVEMAFIKSNSERNVRKLLQQIFGKKNMSYVNICMNLYRNKSRWGV